MKRPKRLNRRMIAVFAGLTALTAVAAPATLQAHHAQGPTQGPIIKTSPPDGSCVYTPTPTLEWQPRLDATRYRVKLVRAQENPDGGETLLYYAAVYTHNTSWTVTDPLAPGTYQWDVRGSNDTSWSQPWTFHVCVS